ncbi:MAG: ABC transporter permease [Chloroflexi bacterium]|nr:ABC transporter permease [Chloroflexota bacterium]
MTAFITHFRFEFNAGIRNKTLLMMNYLLPLGFYLMMGSIMPEINPGFRDSIIPALVTFAILVATLLGLPDPLVGARESGIFRSYKINGIPATSILLIPALTTAMHMLIVVSIITFSAPILFDAPAPGNWLNFTAVCLSTLLACTGIGILIGVVAPSTRLTVLYAQAVFLPSMLIGGVMLPYSLLPETAQKVAQLLPSTHAMNAFYGLAMGGAADFSPWGSVFVLAASGLIALALSIYLFSWDNKNSMRRGHPAMALLLFAPYLIGLLFF